MSWSSPGPQLLYVEYALRFVYIDVHDMFPTCHVHEIIRETADASVSTALLPEAMSRLVMANREIMARTPPGGLGI